MHTVERPGVDPGWAKGWGRLRKKLESQIERNAAFGSDALDYYATHGTRRQGTR